jgi:hypothetical protein
MGTPAPKINAFQISPQKQNNDFLQSGSNDFDKITIIYEDHLPE